MISKNVLCSLCICCLLEASTLADTGILLQLPIIAVNCRIAAIICILLHIIAAILQLTFDTVELRLSERLLSETPIIRT